MVRYLIIFLFFLVSCSSHKTDIVVYPEINKKQKVISSKLKLYDDIDWEPFIGQTLVEAEDTNEFMVIYLYDPDCIACDYMEKTTFSHPDVIRMLNKNFLPIKVDTSQRPDILKALVPYPILPSLVFLKPDGISVGFMQGYIKPKDMTFILTSFSTAIKEHQESTN